MDMAVNPSRIARTMAAATWPDVQFQYKIGPGVFGFTCAGHGGIVAVIGVADLPERAIEAARAKGLIEVVLVESYGRRTRTYTSEKYTAASLRELAARSPEYHTLFEVWVGEEDCDWSTILYANPALIPGAVKAGYTSESCDIDTVRSSLESWNPDYLAVMDGRGFYVRDRLDYDAPRCDDGSVLRLFEVFAVGDDAEPLAVHATREAADQDAAEREGAVVA